MKWHTNIDISSVIGHQSLFLDWYMEWILIQLKLAHNWVRG